VPHWQLARRRGGVPVPLAQCQAWIHTGSGRQLAEPGSIRVHSGRLRVGRRRRVPRCPSILTLMVSEARKKQGAGRLVFNTACHTPISFPVPVPTGHRDGPGVAPGTLGTGRPGSWAPSVTPAPPGPIPICLFFASDKFPGSPRGRPGRGPVPAQAPYEFSSGPRRPRRGRKLLASQDGPMIKAGGPGGRDFGPNRPFKLPGPSPGRHPYVLVTFPQRLPVRSGNTVTAHGGNRK
jgi:hypothetical protein